MCNGRNHDDGCECGFGPPYPVTVKVGPRESWEARSTQSQAEFRRGLQEIGLDEEAIQRHLANYAREGFPLGRGVWARMSHEGKESVITRLRRVLRRHREEVDDEPENLSIRVPIFRLSSPSVPGSRATYQEGATQGADNSWTLTVLGIGMGANQVFDAASTDGFYARSGDCKTFFLALDLLVTPLRIYSGRSFLHRALRVEAQVDRYDGIPGLGVGWCRDRRCYLSQRGFAGLETTKCALGDCLLTRASKLWQRWNLHDDKPGDAFTSSRSIEMRRRGTRKLRYEVSAFGLQAEGRLEITRKVSLTVTFDLPGGYDYVLYRLNEIDGLAWRIGAHWPNGYSTTSSAT